MVADAKETMTNEEYLEVQTKLTLFAAMIIEVDVEGLLERVERADAIVPLIDPTLWMKGHDKLDAIKDLARGALKFKLAACAFRNTMMRLDSKKMKAGEPDGNG